MINKVKKEKVLLLKKYENIQGRYKNVKQVFNDFEQFIMKTTENKSLDRQEMLQKIMQYLQSITPVNSIYTFDVFNKVANSEFFSDFHVEIYDEKIVLSVKTNVKQSLLLFINQYKQMFDNKEMSPNDLFSKSALLVFENEISDLLNNTKNVDFAITIKANNEIKIEMNESHEKTTLFNVAQKLSDLRLAKPNELFNPKNLDCNNLIKDWNTKFVKSYQFQCANFFEQKADLTLFDVLFMLSFVDVADTNNYSFMRLNDNFDDPILRYYGFAFQAEVELISNKTKQSTLKIIKNMATDLNSSALNALKKVPVKFDRYQPIFDPLLQSTSTQSAFIINQNAVNSVQVDMLDKIVPLPFILNIEFN